MVTFPSVEFFNRLAAAMDAAPERYRKLGPVDMTLVPRITMPDGRVRTFVLVFQGYRCVSIAEVDDVARARGPHPVALEGDYDAWREMVDNIHTHGALSTAAVTRAQIFIASFSDRRTRWERPARRRRGFPSARDQAPRDVTPTVSPRLPAPRPHPRSPRGTSASAA